MGIALIAAASLAAGVAYLALRRSDTIALATPVAARTTSPFDEAERILARRYAQDQITAEEYGRMLAILRR